MLFCRDKVQAAKRRCAQEVKDEVIELSESFSEDEDWKAAVQAKAKRRALKKLEEEAEEAKS